MIMIWLPGKGQAISEIIMIMDVRSFAAHWSQLNAKQQECLLRTLEVFLLPGSKGGSVMPGKEVTTGPLQIQGSSLSKKKRQKIIPPPKPRLDAHKLPHFVQEFRSEAPANRHSPQKIGSDGVGLYGRSGFGRKTLKILMERERAERESRRGTS
jgi:hypothetical protein